MSLLPTPRSSDGPKGGPGQVNGRGVPDSLPAIGQLLPTPVVTDSFGARNATSGRKPDSQHHSGWTLNDVRYADRWGEYAAAIARWEHIIGRPAPDPTTDGKLSPDFVEWMMGWPEGWTAIEGASRTQRLKQCGNGVVPQQAAAAFRLILDRIALEECA